MQVLYLASTIINNGGRKKTGRGHAHGRVHERERRVRSIKSFFNRKRARVRARARSSLALASSQDA